MKLRKILNFGQNIGAFSASFTAKFGLDFVLTLENAFS